MIEFTDEFKAAAMDFRRKFGYGLPTAMIPPGTNTEELIRRIRDCISRDNDDLLEQYGVKDAEDCLY